MPGGVVQDPGAAPVSPGDEQRQTFQLGKALDFGLVPQMCNKDAGDGGHGVPAVSAGQDYCREDCKEQLFALSILSVVGKVENLPVKPVLEFGVFGV